MRRLHAFVSLTAVAAVALLATHVPDRLAQDWGHYVAWIVVCVVSDTLWVNTNLGATLSLSSTAGVAALVLWGHPAGIWIGAVGTLVGELFVLRKPWIRAIFNASQITVTVWVAGWVFALLGGPRGGLELSSALGTVVDHTVAVRMGPAMLALVAVYWLVNRAFVVRAVAWASDRRYLKVWREDWLYAQRLSADGASFLLAPLMVISYHAIGYPGVVLFYAATLVRLGCGRA